MAAWRQLRKSPELTDWLTAGLITAAAEIEVLFTATAVHGNLEVRAITSLGLLSVALRRRLALVPVICVSASTILCQLTGGGAQDVVPLLTVFLLAYSLGANAGNLATFIGACMLGSTPLMLHAFGSRSGFSRIESLIWVLGVETVLPILVGRFVRSRARLITRLRQQNLALAEERKSRTLEATLEERLRLAAHLHEVIAASVEAMIAEVAVARADSGPRGLAAVQRVESIARDGLRSMRGTLLDLTSADVR